MSMMQLMTLPVKLTMMLSRLTRISLQHQLTLLGWMLDLWNILLKHLKMLFIKRLQYFQVLIYRLVDMLYVI